MKGIKKFFKYFFTSLIVVSAMFSSFACTNNETSSIEKENNDSNHVENMTPTDEYLLFQGKSDYRIVYADSANADEKLAVSEIQRYFKEGTGVELIALTDKQVTEYNEDSKYIIVGDNDFSREEKITPDKNKYGRPGYVIKTVDNCIFITGAYSIGTVCGTYKFLNYILDFDYFYEDIYSLKNNVATIPLMDYDVSIIYDIEFSEFRMGYSNSRTGRLKYSTLMAEKTAIGGLSGHASMKYLPIETYLNADDPENYHPDWYMSSHNPDQLCFTAHGKAEEYDLMVKTAAKVITDIFEVNPDAYVFDCSMSDNQMWCSCEGCQPKIAKYGSNAITQIHFLNDVTDTINAWFETEEGSPYKRDYSIIFYAYFSLSVPPVVYNKQMDTYSVVDDSVYVNDNVVPQIADTGYDTTQSIYAEVNKETRQSFRGWGHISENIGGYFYSARYNDLLQPFESLNDLQELYQFLAENGVHLLTNSGSELETGVGTGFTALKSYMHAKLVCDVDIDFNEYVDKFFDNVYLDASETMKQIYNEWRYLDAYNTNFYPTYAGKSAYLKNIAKEEYFPLSTLKRWKGLFEEALKQIEPLKETNPDRYALTYKMIVGERVFVNYLMYKIYAFNLPLAELTPLKMELISDLNKAGVSRWRGNPTFYAGDLIEELKK